MRSSVQPATKLNRKISSILTKPKVQTKEEDEHLSSQRKNRAKLKKESTSSSNTSYSFSPAAHDQISDYLQAQQQIKFSSFFFLHNLARTVELSAIKSSPPFLGIHDLVSSKVCLQIQEPMRRLTCLQLLAKCSPNLYNSLEIETRILVGRIEQRKKRKRSANRYRGLRGKRGHCFILFHHQKLTP